jgi:hypothetical protein
MVRGVGEKETAAFTAPSRREVNERGRPGPRSGVGRCSAGLGAQRARNASAAARLGEGERAAGP